MNARAWCECTVMGRQTGAMLWHRAEHGARQQNMSSVYGQTDMTRAALLAVVDW